MFELSTVERVIVVVLLVAWAGQLFGGFLIFSQENDAQTHRIPTHLRMGSSAVLVILAWLIYIFVQDTIDHALPLWFALGMTLGFIGDLFMARLLIKQDHYVLAGIAAFGLCHVFYIIGLIRYGDAQALTWTPTFTAALSGWLIFGVIGWFVVVFFKNARTTMHLAALPYTLLLSSTAGAATGLALQSSTFGFVALGAALFLFSDLVLAAQLFRNMYFRGIGDVVWLTYGPGQMLIVCGVILAQWM